MFPQLLVLALVIAVFVLWLQVSDQARRLRALEEQLQAMQTREAAQRLRQPSSTQSPLTPETAQADAPAAATPLTPAAASAYSYQAAEASRHVSGHHSSETHAVGINFLAPYRAGGAEQRRGALTAGALPSPTNQPAWGGQPFAVLGGLLTLLGLGAVLSQLVKAGFFTPELQLAAAFGLAGLLYALAERARPAVGAVLRGLGYGIAALAFGAMFQAGALPVLAVLGLTGLLSLLVGWHAWRRREPLTLLVALSGATLSTWLLADDLAEQLGTLGTAQTALTVVFAAALWSIWRGRELATNAPSQSARWPLAALPLLLPLGTLGLWISAAAHHLSGEGLLWLLMGGLGLLGLTLTAPAPEPEPEPNQVSGPASRPDKRRAIQAVALASLALLTAGPLLWPVGGRPLLPSALGLLLVTLAALAWRLRGFPAVWRGRQPDLLRDALVLAALGLAASLTERWTALHLGNLGTPLPLELRLLPYALLAALYGGWSGSRAWQSSGVALGAWLLLSAAAAAGTTGEQLLLGLGALGALGTALRLTSARSGAVLLAAAAFALVGAFQVGTANSGALPFLPLLSALALALWAGTRWQGRLLWFGGWTLGLGAVVGLGNLLIEGVIGRGLPGQLALLWLQLSAAAAGLLVLSAAPAVKSAWQTLEMSLRWPLNRWAAGLELAATAAWLLGTAFFLRGWLGQEETASLLVGALAALLSPLLTRWPLHSQPLISRVLLLAGLLAALTAPALLTLNESERFGLGSGWLALLTASAALVWATRPGPQRQPPLLPLPGWSLLLVASALAQSLGRLLALSLGLRLDELSAHLLSTGLLLLSGLVGLLWAYRTEQRPQWWAGLALFGLGAVKLVMSDLDGLGLSARGLGLTLVGLLLLGIGQLAPAEEERRER